MTPFSLRALARLHGIQLTYTDISGRHHTAGEDALLALIRAMGTEIAGVDDAPRALRDYRARLSRRLVPPCAVAWDGHATEVCIPPAPRELDWAIVREDGQSQGPVAEGRVAAGARLFPIPALPLGAYRVQVAAGSQQDHMAILAAPRQLPAAGEPTWGVFAPLYGLRSSRASGGATLTELGTLGRWANQVGGGTVGTLPLLSSFHDRLRELSPYRPVSRQFWNELYLDPEATEDFEDCAEARALWSSETMRSDTALLMQAERLDVWSLMAARRSVLEALAAHAHRTPARRRALEHHLEAHPELRDYARFRAAVHHHGCGWQGWPAAAREGTLSDTEVPEDQVRYHAYVQWQLHLQLERAAENARQGGAGLYLDLPVGVHPDGFDTYSDRDSFCLMAEAGAPPDDLNIEGQNWALPVLHPHNTRDSGHAHLRACLRAHLRYAGVLRIDHVMGLRRLFWIPRGATARDGVYVRYAADEQWAALSLEAHRAGAVIVGEDLGTVPDAVRAEMQEHRAPGMSVGMFSFGGALGSTMHPPKQGSVASFGTHDTPTFAGFARGRDLDLQLQLGQIDAEQREAALAGRRGLIGHLAHHAGAADPGDQPPDDDTLRAIHDQLISEMAESPAWMILVTLEDLWLETEPQNVPGTGAELGNWTRRLRRDLDELAGDDDLRARLRRVLGDRARR